MENDPAKLFDKIGRAFGILQNGHLLSSSDCMNQLSLPRLDVDLEFPDESRVTIDRPSIEAQPGHIQYTYSEPELEFAERDMLRVSRLRTEFAKFAPRAFPTFHKSPRP